MPGDPSKVAADIAADQQAKLDDTAKRLAASKAASDAAAADQAVQEADRTLASDLAADFPDGVVLLKDDGTADYYRADPTSAAGFSISHPAVANSPTPSPTPAPNPTPSPVSPNPMGGNSSILPDQT